MRVYILRVAAAVMLGVQWSTVDKPPCCARNVLPGPKLKKPAHLLQFATDGQQIQGPVPTARAIYMSGGVLYLTYHLQSDHQ